MFADSSTPDPDGAYPRPEARAPPGARRGHVLAAGHHRARGQGAPRVLLPQVPGQHRHHLLAFYEVLHESQFFHNR